MGFSFGRNWEAECDRWKTTPPEDELPESRVKCIVCNEELFPGDDVYVIDDEYYCEEHANEWLEDHRREVDEEMAFGE